MSGPWLPRGIAAAMVAATLVGCNGLLGIGPASMEADDGGDGGTPPVRALTCAYYCATMVQNCTQASAEFVGSEDPMTLCMTMCPVFDQGTSIAASNDDTLGCRIFYAEQAQTDPATNCRFAGPPGGGKCGTDPCQTFCSLDVQYCNAAPVSTPAYASNAECLAACAGSADGGAGYPYLTTGPDLLDTTNTLNCRFWHLENAYGSQTSGAFHCPHTKQISDKCN